MPTGVGIWKPLTDGEQAINTASYSLSSNYYTGKFIFNTSRSSDEIKVFAEKYAYYDLSEAHKAMQSTAEAFANKFTSITGNLSLEREEVVDMVESSYDDSGLTEYVYQG